MISGRTGLLALIGHPVGHSLSPAMHNASFAALGLDLVYVCLDVPPARLPDAVRGVAALGLRGLNVTMPHKRAIISLLDEIDADARVSGAVNTVVGDREGEAAVLRGYNTDGGGLVLACRERGIDLRERSVLLLGAGGAAAAIALAFAREGIRHLHVAGRTLRAAEDLAGRLGDAGVGGVSVHPYDPADLPRAEVVVNATPLGMNDADALPIPADYLGPGVSVCDAVYRPGMETRLVRLCAEKGVSAVAGDRMLLYQGVLAQRLWTGAEPDLGAMDAAVSGRA